MAISSNNANKEVDRYPVIKGELPSLGKGLHIKSRARTTVKYIDDSVEYTAQFEGQIVDNIPHRGTLYLPPYVGDLNILYLDGDFSQYEKSRYINECTYIFKYDGNRYVFNGTVDNKLKPLKGTIRNDITCNSSVEFDGFPRIKSIRINISNLGRSYNIISIREFNSITDFFSLVNDVITCGTEILTQPHEVNGSIKITPQYGHESPSITYHNDPINKKFKLILDTAKFNLSLGKDRGILVNKEEDWQYCGNFKDLVPDPDCTSKFIDLVSYQECNNRPVRDK